MSRRVQVDAWAWDLICEHYAQIADPTPDDRRVMTYMMDKLARQMAHDAYASQRRLDELPTVTDD